MSVTSLLKNMLHRRSGPVSISQIMKKASHHFGSTFLRAMEKQLNRGSNELRNQQIQEFEKIYFEHFEMRIEDYIVLDIFGIQKNQLLRDNANISSPEKSFRKKTTLSPELEAQLMI